MPKSTTYANDLIGLLFNAAAIANIADNAASSPITNIHVSLHTADPGVGGSQLTNETSYTNYARQPVARTTGGWTAPSGGATSNVALVQFPTCGVTGATLTYVGVGKDLSGAGKMFYDGALTSPLAVSNGIQPQFAIGALTVTES